MFLRPHFSPEEQEVIRQCSTPVAVQEYISRKIRYDVGRFARTFRRVLLEKKATCLDGALFAACILEWYGHRPRILCLEGPSIDHCLFAYQDGAAKTWGTVGQSESYDLRGRMPVFLHAAQAARFYRASAYRSLRGFTDVDLTLLRSNWRTGTSADGVNRLLFEVPYVSLGPEREGDFYVSDYHSNRTWLTVGQMKSLRRKFKGILELRDLDDYDGVTQVA